MNFLQQINPSPILFHFYSVNIYWYGFLVVLSLIIGLGLVIFLGRQKNVKSDDVFDLALWLMLGGIIGARVYAVLIDWQYYQNNPIAIFKIWEGGLAIHGAIIGGLLALYFWRRHKKYPLPFLAITDLIAPALALGQAIGRWGNYFNQELFGRPTDWPIGIPIGVANRPVEFAEFQYFQPAFLYESILDFVLFLILFFFVKKNKHKTGAPTFIYLIGYSIIRFFLEFIRLDPTPEFWGLRFPQWVSVIIVLLILTKYRKWISFKAGH